MSLLKLWNALRGRGPADESATPIGPVDTPATATHSAKPTSGRIARSSRPEVPTRAMSQPTDPSPSAADNRAPSHNGGSSKRAAAKRTKRRRTNAVEAISTDEIVAVAGGSIDPGMQLLPSSKGFFQKSPHAGLSKQIGAAVAQRDGIIKVLEIGVGDGQRTQTILQTLRELKTTDQIRYAAVDTFEMGDGPITLKAFSALARQYNVTPQLFPMPTIAGLTRLVHTLGQVDIVIDAQRFHQTPEAAKLLPKLAGVDTLWLVASDDGWSAVSPVPTTAMPQSRSVPPVRRAA